MSKKRFKVAFIGAGGMTIEHLKAFWELDQVILCGIYSRTRARADSLVASYPDMKVYDSISELHKNTNADLVIVSVNELSMREVAIECFGYPWLIFLEKPAGYNLAESTEILLQAKTSKSKVYVALNRRMYSSTLSAQKLIASTSGRRFIVVQDQQDQSSVLALQQSMPLVVENYMYANSVHLIDYFMQFGRGVVERVDLIEPWDPTNPGIVVAKIEFSSGDLGLYEGVWKGPGPWGVSVSTAEVRMEMKPLEVLVYQNNGSRELIKENLDPIDIKYKPGLRKQAIALIEILNGGRANLATLDDSHATMELIARIFSQK